MDEDEADDRDEVEEGPSKEEWNAVRKLLKDDVLSGLIPYVLKEMRPAAVYQMYADAANPIIECVDYANKRQNAKFTLMLRTLRNKHANGDLVNEDKAKPIVWRKSAAKQYLKKAFREGLIPDNISTNEDMEEIWNDLCKDQPAFARMEFDAAFIRRLQGVRDDYLKKVVRRDNDVAAYLAAKQNHPTPEFNSRGEPQWNGSQAQKDLKVLVASGGHENKKPKELWESSQAYQVYPLYIFRDHIYQEERLLKFDNYTAALKQKKIDKLQY